MVGNGIGIFMSFIPGNGIFLNVTENGKDILKIATGFQDILLMGM